MRKTQETTSKLEGSNDEKKEEEKGMKAQQEKAKNRTADRVIPSHKEENRSKVETSEAVRRSIDTGKSESSRSRSNIDNAKGNSTRTSTGSSVGSDSDAYRRPSSSCNSSERYSMDRCTTAAEGRRTASEKDTLVRSSASQLTLWCCCLA